MNRHTLIKGSIGSLATTIKLSVCGHLWLIPFYTTLNRFKSLHLKSSFPQQVMALASGRWLKKSREEQINEALHIFLLVIKYLPLNVNHF